MLQRDQQAVVCFALVYSALMTDDSVCVRTAHRVCEGSACHREVRVSSLGEEVTLLPGVGVQYGRFKYDLNQAKAVRSKLDAFEISVTPGGSILFNAPNVGFAVIVNSIGNVVVGVSL